MVPKQWGVLFQGGAVIIFVSKLSYKVNFFQSWFCFCPGINKGHLEVECMMKSLRSYLSPCRNFLNYCFCKRDFNFPFWVSLHLILKVWSTELGKGQRPFFLLRRGILEIGFGPRVDGMKLLCSCLHVSADAWLGFLGLHDQDVSTVIHSFSTALKWTANSRIMGPNIRSGSPSFRSPYVIRLNPWRIRVNSPKNQSDMGSIVKRDLGQRLLERQIGINRKEQI